MLFINLLNKKLHIVSFDIPFPPNYGGVIDVFYKIKALHLLGWKIHLHCFLYGRKEAKELEMYCEKVSYYPRDIARSKLFQRLPYIVSSRNNKHLTDALLADNSPILFEGLHTTFPLQDKRLKGRKMIVRSHNIEHEYYRHLGLAENNLFKRYYFNSEATKLESYEPIFKNTTGIAAISRSETKHFQKHYGNKAFYLPAFHPYEKAIQPKGIGKYALYHGNLSIAENHKAAMFLIKEVFNDLNIEFIIAGNHPNAELKKAIKLSPSFKLIENPTNLIMEKLISEAQLHVLPAFQSTGIKLKLLAALFNGRHVITNSTMTEGTGLDDLCEIANNPFEIKKKIMDLSDVSVSIKNQNKRESILIQEFSNSISAKELEKHLNNY